MKVIRKVNYINKTEIFALIENSILENIDTIKKVELLKILKDKRLFNKEIEYIILNYPNKWKKYIDCKAFYNEVVNSFMLNKYFKINRLKGFSFKFYKNVTGFRFKMAKSVNLRFALISDKNLFYPLRVKGALRKNYMNHIFIDGNPSIAFALGKEIKNNWYILTLQSDLPLFKYSFLRDYFKDWSKLLFNLILENKKKNIKNIFLCPSKGVIYTCHNKFSTPYEVPRSWKLIYDNTAKFFNMKLTKTDYDIDIQLYPKRKQIPYNLFYKYNLH